MSTRSVGMTRRIGGRRAVLAGASIAAIVAGSLAAAGPAAARGPFRPSGAPSVASSDSAAKSPSSRLAQTDPKLLTITSSAPVHVIVKLDYDSLATYTGTIPGYPATSPLVTHKPLNVTSAAAQKYLQHVGAVQSRFTSALSSAVPSARTGASYTALYGGVALTVPGNEIARVLSLPGVAAIQSDSLHKPTSVTPVSDDDASFIGANSAYSALGSNATAGQGVIIADIDTGVWPEHPSFANRSDLNAPPPTPDGHARACNFGTDPLTHAAFACNDKLIEGQVFLNTYNALFPTGPNAELYPSTARDSNGHGTHTTSTSGGNPIAHPVLFGIDRGPIQGIAPGAWLMSYKVLGPAGGFDSDLVAGIEQAVLDGANVINYSIGPSTPTSAYTSPDDLAFLDAYDAGVVVSASAGNSGPGAQSVSHLGPWEITVGATTLQRAFVSTATLSAPGAANLVVSGSSIMPGISSSTPVVLASAAPYSDSRCGHPAAPGTFTGKIVVCVRGGLDSGGNPIGRAQKGFDVLQGGAAGMFLVNPVVEDTETDNHFLPAVHFDAPAGNQVVAYVSGHSGVTATFTTGQKANGQGDVMAAFSSRGPGGDFLKPDIAAPGVQILAGNTPTPTDVASGPPGQYYQAIAGTSMAAPHITGSAALVLALHPGLTPAEVKSVLMMTANTNVVEQDGTTHAGPFDDGAGRVDLTGVVDPGLAMDVSNANMDAVLVDPLHRIDLNEPSVYDAALPGKVTTTRTFTNIDAVPEVYQFSATSTLPGSITVSPSVVNIPGGQSRTVTITLDASSGTVGSWYSGEIDLTQIGGTRRLHLPVAFSPSAPAANALATSTNCAPATIALAVQNTVCTTSVQNNLLQDASVSANVSTTRNLQILSVGAGGKRTATGASYGPVALAAAIPPKPTVGPGSDPNGGFFDLSRDPFALSFNLGDETITNLQGFGGFVYDGQSYSRVGVASDGYLVVGGGDGNDVNPVPQTFPDPARPNNVLAPFWTDLDGGNGGIPGEGGFADVLSDGTNAWLVVQWNAHLFGTTNVEHFQVWLGLNGTQDISYSYGAMVDPGTTQALNIGAENADGTAGSNVSGMPTGDLVVTSSPQIPGGSVSFSTTIRGVTRGTGTVETDVFSPQIRDTVVTKNNIAVS